MSVVKRYTAVDSEASVAYVWEDLNGKFVTHADYLALAARLAASEEQGRRMEDAANRAVARLAAVEAERDEALRLADVRQGLFEAAEENKTKWFNRNLAAESALAALRERVLGVAAEWVMPDPTWRGGVTDAFNQCADDVLAAIGPVDGCDSAQEKQK
jgi:hypothetical protein